MPEKSIAVAILNWNGQKLLQEFLPSVVEHSGAAKIVVIDNASTDDSISLLESSFPNVQLVKLKQNYGYAGGYNNGIDFIEEEYLVLLNSDVQVTANWLSPLYKRMEADNKLAAIQPKILDYKYPHLFEYAGASGGYIDKLAYPFCRGRIFYELEEDSHQYDDYSEIFWATGACLMVRKSAFLDAGGFNQKLFAHMEEIDLCWRLQNMSYKIACEPASKVYHLGGGTLNKLSPQKTYLNFRNNLIIIFLNTPNWESLRIIFIRLIMDGLAAIKFLVDRQGKHLFAVLRAHFAFYGMMHKLFIEKRNIPQKSIYTLNGVFKKSVVWEFFLKKRKKFSELDKF